ncbi:MAG TPA: glycosyltransferase family 9 protein [Candidatus Bathyarchaeia archaeon]|nr:glycosyltransferase family 9 protein [Candidatus Bathyarchaeia archaeon]
MTSFYCFVRVPTRLAIIWRKYLAKGTRRASRHAPVPSILVVRLDQLGDLALATPLFRELKRLYPVAKITAVVPTQFKPLLTTNRNVDELLGFGGMTSKLLPERLCRLLSALRFYLVHLRRRKFALAISPRWDVDDGLATLLCTLADAQRRVGYTSSACDAKRRLNHGFDAAFDVIVPAGGLRHELDRNLAIIEALGGTVKSSRLDIRLTGNDRRVAQELLTHHNRRRHLVAISIGGRAPGRKWPLERYAEVITQLNRSHRVQPVILCGADEEPHASALSSQLPVAPYILAGLPLRSICAVLDRCRVFIGNDSGPAHLAAAMNCATIVISRHPANGDPSHPNSPVRFAPRCDHSVVVQPPHGLDGCVDFCRREQPHCILQVTAQQVVDVAHALLLRDDARTDHPRPPADTSAVCKTGQSPVEASGLN